VYQRKRVYRPHSQEKNKIMHKPTYTRPVPAGAKTRVVKGKTEVCLMHDGKMTWFPLSKGGRARIPSKDWHGQVRLANGQIVTIRLVKNKEASQRILHNRQIKEDNIASGRELPALIETTKPLAEYVCQFEAERASSGISHKTLANTRPALRRALADLELVTVQDLRALTSEWISQWFVGMDKAPGTKGKILETLKLFTRWMADRSLLAASPKFPKYSTKIVCARRPLTIDEVERLAKVSPWPRSLLYRLAFATIARRSALMNLKAEDLKFGSAGVTIMLRPELAKTKQGQQVPAPGHLTADLQRLVGECPTGNLFAGARQGNFSENFNSDLKAAKIEKLTADGAACFHSLRHGGTTHLIRSGVPMVLVQRMGGWVNLNILAKHYSHLSPVTDREQIDRAMSPSKKTD
jgi:integrase